MVHLGDNQKTEHVFGCLPKALPISLSIMAIILAFTAGQAWSALPQDKKDNVLSNDMSQDQLMFLLSVAGRCLPEMMTLERTMTQSFDTVFRSPAEKNTLRQGHIDFGICIPLSPLIKTRKSENDMPQPEADPRQQMVRFNAMCNQYESHGIGKHSSWKSHV